MGVQISGDTGNVLATKGTYTGNLTVGGVLTYEDVTNVDSVGLVTARSGIEIGARPGVAASISVDGNMIVSGIATIGSKLGIGGITPSNALDVQGGTTNTAIVARSTDTKAQISLVDNSTTSVGSVVVGAVGDALFFTSGSGGAERARIDSDGHFGIGMSPSGVRLDVTSTVNDIARFSGANSGGITIRNDTTNEIQIHSGTSDALIFGTNGENERLRIYANGAVLIGADSGEAGGDAKLAIDCQGMNIYDGVGDASNYGLIFANDSTTDKANGIGFFNDSASTCGGYIVHQDKGGGNIGDLVFGTSASSDTPVERLRISSAGNVTVADGNLIFGANGNALDFQNQTIESTSNYNRTVTAEKIDYYEEGYFDPTAISAGLTWETSGNRQLRYVRIGNWVSVSGYLQLVSRTSNSNVIQVAMPFTSAPNSSGYYTRGVGAAMYQNVTLTTNYTELVSYVGGGENYMRFFQLRSGHGWQQLMNSNLGSDSTTAIYFSINYMVA